MTTIFQGIFEKIIRYIIFKKEQEKKHNTELQNALNEFAEVRERAKDFDELEVMDYRLSVRNVKKAEYYERIEKENGKHYYPADAIASLAQADNMLDEDLPETRASIRWNLRIEQEKQRRAGCSQQRKEQPKSHNDWDMER